MAVGLVYRPGQIGLQAKGQEALGSRGTFIEKERVCWSGFLNGTPKKYQDPGFLGVA